MRNEDALQKEVVKFLNDAMPLTSWFTATANGAVLAGSKQKRMMQSAKLKAMGVKNGTPDLIICYDSRFFGIELKLPKTADHAKTYQSKDQRDVEDAIGLAGGGYAVCRSVEQVVTQLMAWRIPVRKVWFPHLCFAGEPMRRGEFREDFWDEQSLRGQLLASIAMEE